MNPLSIEEMERFPDADVDNDTRQWIQDRPSPPRRRDNGNDTQH